MTDKLPLHIVTGFLGSGKTTLLNRILREPALADSAILINEIGAIAIDHHLVQRMERSDAIEIIVLKGGCTCCTVRGDLVEALRDLYDRRMRGDLPPFRRVIMETTGLADPAPVLFTLASDPLLRHKFEAGAIVATVDAVHGAQQLARYPESRKQVALADRLIITKSDLTESSTESNLRTTLARINAIAGIIDVHCVDSVLQLLENRDPARQRFSDFAFAQSLGNERPISLHRADHTQGVASVAFTLSESIEWAPFAVWLSLFLHAYGEQVLRFKALLNVAGWTGPVMLDGIHHLIHPPIHQLGWPVGPRVSRIVVIAKELNMSRIESSLSNFLTEHATQHDGDPTEVADRASVD